jgi:RNA polymerase sigma factor (sigma-70 family)
MIYSQDDYQKVYLKVLGFFYRRVYNRSDVEILATETVNDFLLKDKDIDQDMHYCWGIARNKLKQYFSSKNKHRHLELDENKDSATDNYAPEYELRMQSLIACLKGVLKPQDMSIVEMCVLEDFSSKQASKELGLKPDNVRQRLSRALAKARDKCAKVWLN